MLPFWKTKFNAVGCDRKRVVTFLSFEFFPGRFVIIHVSSTLFTDLGGQLVWEKGCIKTS
jgi:hypothetical protein